MQYWQKHRMELVEYHDRGDEVEVHVAVDNRLAIPMDVHKSVRDLYQTEDDWFDYLTHSAEMMLDLYGDARYPVRVTEEVIEQFAT